MRLNDTVGTGPDWCHPESPPGPGQGLVVEVTTDGHATVAWHPDPESNDADAGPSDSSDARDAEEDLLGGDRIVETYRNGAGGKFDLRRLPNAETMTNKEFCNLAEGYGGQMWVSATSIVSRPQCLHL